MSCKQPFNILVVDDNFGAAHMVAEVLFRLGHRTRIAYGGEESIRASMAESPDVIFMDVHMPDLGGYEAAKRIKTLVPGVWVIGMSGLQILKDHEDGGFVVFDRTLAKPFHPTKVRELLTEMRVG